MRACACVRACVRPRVRACVHVSMDVLAYECVWIRRPGSLKSRFRAILRKFMNASGKPGGTADLRGEPDSRRKSSHTESPGREILAISPLSGGISPLKKTSLLGSNPPTADIDFANRRQGSTRLRTPAAKRMSGGVTASSPAEDFSFILAQPQAQGLVSKGFNFPHVRGPT